MDRLNEIAQIINQYDSVALVVHVNPDGDCLGSACALASILDENGKKVRVFSASPIPERFNFLGFDKYVEVNTPNVFFDVCIAIDVASENMMGSSLESVYDNSRIKCCIDHHKTNGGYAQYNYVDAHASATGEIIYTFIAQYLKYRITDECAEFLYVAVASDSGSFRYSNTTPDTLRIASELVGYGFDASEIMYSLFEQKTLSQLRLNADVVSGLKFFAGGKICIAVVDRNLLDKYDMTFDDADDIASLPRSVKGVEVGVYIKKKSENEIKVSLRSNQYVDVAKIASEYGGGGHTKAAGVTMNMSLDEVMSVLVDRILKEIR